MDQALLTLSSSIGSGLLDRDYTISTAESCTGGLLSHVLTGISGSSTYFMGGVVAYSNAIKEQVLGVRSETLQQYGAVSEQTAREMADGIRKKFGTDIGLSTTGVAGPTGGTHDKPVGLVWMGISTPAVTHAFKCRFKGERLDIMRSTVIEILTCLLSELKTPIL
jgi:nicotinamide-nucleotide amidase